MKEQIMQNLSAVIGALNNITVSGKNNLSNLAGSISVLEEVLSALAQAEFADEYNESKGEASPEA